MADSNSGQGSGHFKGGGLFTTSNPKVINSLSNKPQWVALEVDTNGNLEGGVTASDVQQWQSQNIKVYVWAGGVNSDNPNDAGKQDKWNNAAISAAQQYGASGVIFQGETQVEMNSAMSAADKSGMPTGIVGNPGLVPPGGWKPGVTALAEVYPANPYQTVSNMVATAQRAGATDIVPIYGYYNDGAVHPTQSISTFDSQAQALGVTDFGVFNAETVLSSPEDKNVLSNRYGNPGSGGPLPTLSSPSRTPAPVFQGTTVFTSNAPTYALPLAGTVDGVGVKVGGPDGVGPGGQDPAVISTLQNAKMRVYLWASPAGSDYNGQVASNQQTVAMAQQYGTGGVILPAMNSSQMKAAAATAATSGGPVAIITNKATLESGGVPAGVTVMLLGEGMTPEELANYAATHPNIIPVVPAYDDASTGTNTNSQNLMPAYLTDLGGGSVGIFTLESNSYNATNLGAVGSYLVDKALGRLPAGASAAGNTPEKPLAAGQSAAPDRDHPGGDTRSYPPPYTGGAPVSKVLHLSDGSTVTITVTGAVIKEGRSGNPYREGWVDPNTISSITADNLSDRIKPGVGADKSSPFAAPNDPTQPAWRQDPDWRQPTQDELAWIKNRPNFDASGVLEVRPANDNSGDLILRMSDGSYLRINQETTATPVVGNWDNNQWSTYQTVGAAGVVNPKGGDTSSSGESNNDINTKPVPIGSPTSGNSPGAETEWNQTVISQAIDNIGDSDPEAKSILKKEKHALKSGASGGSDSGNSGSGGGATNPDPMAVTIVAGSTNYEAPAQLVGTGGYDPGSAGTGGCFIAGSKIMTPDGEKAIEEIKLGDTVITWNMEKHAPEPTQVTDILAHHDRHTIMVETESGKKVTTTVEHPFWTGSDWVPAGMLKANESTIFDSQGQPKKVTAVTDGPKANVYNFHVAAPAHNYFVDGLLVHNSKMAGM